MEEIDAQIVALFVRRIAASAGVEPSAARLSPSAATVAQLREVVELLTRRERARHRLTRSDDDGLAADRLRARTVRAVATFE